MTDWNAHFQGVPEKYESTVGAEIVVPKKELLITGIVAVAAFLFFSRKRTPGDRKTLPSPPPQRFSYYPKTAHGSMAYALSRRSR